MIPPAKTDEFIQQLPIEKLHGVGKVTARKLHDLGIRTCADIREYDRFSFIDRVGSFGEHLYRLAHGIDERPVQPRSTRKSLSVEHTYPDDLPDLAACQAKLPELKQKLEQRLERAKRHSPIKKAFVKLKFSDFTSTTMECCNGNPSLDTYRELFDQAFKRKEQAVRLLGVGVRFQEQERTPQNQIAFEF